MSIRGLGLAAVLLAMAATPARAQDDELVGGDPRAQADQIDAQARQFFESHDYRAAGIWFDQARRLYQRLERGPDGQIVDPDAHLLAVKTLLRAATAYTQAGMPVEALDRLTEARDQFAAEIAAIEAESGRTVDVAGGIARLTALVGRLQLDGLPDRAEVRIDGRLVRDAATGGLRLAAGDHALDIRAPGYRRLVQEIGVPGQDLARLAVVLEPLHTPARLRIETAAARAHVSVDGRPLGDTPVEASLPPGEHHYAVDSEAYRPAAGSVTLAPGEHAVLRVGLVPRRAPSGLRVEPRALFSFPLRTDTPMGEWAAGAGIAVFHDWLQVRNLRGGLLVEAHARELNRIALGGVLTWCPDRTARASGGLAWCPANAELAAVFGGNAEAYGTRWRAGDALARLDSAVEVRGGARFGRLAAGVELTDYRSDAGSILVLWSAVVELAVGLDL